LAAQIEVTTRRDGGRGASHAAPGSQVTVRLPGEDELARSSIKKGDFIESYEKTEEKLKSSIGRFLKVQDDERVHDLRTAMRRAQMHVKLLPRSARRDDSTRRFSKDRKRAFKLTAGMRDLDIIRARLLTLPESEERDAAVVRVDGERMGLVKEARRAVAALGGDSMPKPGKKEVTARKLRKRFRGQVDELSGEIGRRLPVVLEDETKKTELHLLRMGCKRLRYTLEAAARQSEKGPPRVMGSLKAWSDALGTVHDWDVVGSYLGENGQRAKGLIASVERAREEAYQSFLRRAVEGAGKKAPPVAAVPKKGGGRRGVGARLS